MCIGANKMHTGSLWILVAVCLLHVAVVTRAFDLTLLHTNDVHARFEQFNKFGTACSPANDADGKCFGGVARRMTKVREIRASHDNVLLLDAGDQFLGTLWFNFFKGMAASFFMQEIGYDIMCFGNHEFDLGVEGLVKFLDNITFPVVSANTDVPGEPRLQGRFTKSHVFTIDGEKIAVVGYITQETEYISNAGSTVLFADVLTTVEAEVARLTNDGINKIIALGHAGFAMDKQVALLEDIDVVIGGHTNTFLYTGFDPSDEIAQGEYPTVITKPSGSRALVVQAFTWGKYLGYLNVSFNSAGEITAYTGNPILLDNSIEQDATVLQEINRWSESLNQLSTEEVGSTKITLDGSRESCRLGECTMGNLLTDAIIDHHLSYGHSNTSWAPAAIALWNGGGIRASIDKGPVTLGEVMTVLPFGNEIDLIHVRGSNLRRQLEVSVSEVDPLEAHGRFLQMSGLKVEYNIANPPGERVVTVDVRCVECEVPSYSPLIDTSVYPIFTSTFIRTGGDGYSFEPVNVERFNTLETDALIGYFRKHSPLYVELQGRIKYSTVGDTSSAVLTTCSFLVITFMTLTLNLF